MFYINCRGIYLHAFMQTLIWSSYFKSHQWFSSCGKASVFTLAKFSLDYCYYLIILSRLWFGTEKWPVSGWVGSPPRNRIEPNWVAAVTEQDHATESSVLVIDCCNCCFWPGQLLSRACFLFLHQAKNSSCIAVVFLGFLGLVVLLSLPFDFSASDGLLHWQ